MVREGSGAGDLHWLVQSNLVCKTNWNPWHADPQILHPTLRVKPWDSPFSTLNTPYCQHNSPPSVSKLKPASPRYLPYLDAFPGVVVPRINPARRVDMVRLLKLGWQLDAIAELLHVSRTTVYNTEHYLIRYSQPIRPYVRKTGQPAALTRANREALLKFLLQDVRWWSHLAYMYCSAQLCLASS
jgi:hypothetical protein